MTFQNFQRAAGRIGAALLMSAATMTAALAADFPTKPITLIVGFAAGGQTDVQARAVANAASKELGQPIVVVNRPGMAATLGPAQMAETAAPDGYTLAVLPATLTRIPHVNKVKFDPRKDFTLLLKVTSFNFGLVVKADSPFKSIHQLIDYARANPGKLSYGTSGVGGSPHIAVERLSKATGVEFNMVPFSGATPIFQNIMGGHVDFSAEAGFGPFVDDGRFRVLALFSDKRLPNRPQWTTLREEKIDVVAESWWGLGGPKGMDPKVAKVLHDAFKKALNDPEVNRILEKNDQIVTYLNPKDFQAEIEREYANEARFMKDFKLIAR
jgi:tripartite-type tricarboxylate transporter receptor subunit TctC